MRCKSYQMDFKHVKKKQYNFKIMAMDFDLSNV